MKKVFIFLMVLCISICSVQFAGASNVPSKEQAFERYHDVPDEAWYTDYIYTMTRLGLLNGVGEGYFLPEKSITLAETITIAARLSKMYSENEENTEFSNQGREAEPWYVSYLEYCDREGILEASGFQEMNDEVLNRASARAIVAVLLRNALPEDHFIELNTISDGELSDVPLKTEWSDEVYSLYRSGILTGMDQYGTFAPVRNITRAEVAAILSRIVVPSMRCSSSFVKKENYDEAVYLGVKNYGNISADNSNDFQYQFSVNGYTEQYSINSDNNSFPIQNVLEEGKLYELTMQDHCIQSVRSPSESASGMIEKTDSNSFTINGVSLPVSDVKIYRITTKAGGATVSSDSLSVGDYVKVFGRSGHLTSVYISQQPANYIPPISGTPGVHTIKNLLMTATEPIGTTLYIYGGDWNWQDTGGSRYSTQIGVPQSWMDFYASKTADYHYKNPNASISYYPFGRFNEYYYAGADCTGYLGWTVYNCIHTQNGGESYVTKSNYFAKNLSEHFGYGSWQHRFKKSDLLPGDIVSMDGHVWMCLGRCQDGSVIIMHSTPAQSYTGGEGGGPELSVLGDRGSRAYTLASRYMKEFYPSWSSRYPVKTISYSSYAGGSVATTGLFSWRMGAVLSDPEGIRNMSADDVLMSIYGK